MDKNKKRTSDRIETPAGPPPIAPTPGWPADAVRALIALWEDGLTASEIAGRLGKTRRAVECKLYKLRAQGCPLGLRRASCRPRRARRRCLYCGATFLSEHPGNRLCPVCLADGPFTGSLV